MYPPFYRLLALDRRLHAEIANELTRVTPRPWRLLRLRMLRLAIKARLSGALHRVAAA